MSGELDPDKPSVYNNLNTTSQEIASFLAAIRANPDDETNRLVFADFLDEKFPELAEVSALYRGGARKWMEKFVEGEQTCLNYSEACESSWRYYQAERDGLPLPDVIDYVYAPVTVADALEAGRVLLASEGDERFVQRGEEGLRDKMFEDNNFEMYWRCFSVLTGEAVDPAPAWTSYWGGMSPFSCSC
jgi:uncharacterized protein (TIGR02996 family)